MLSLRIEKRACVMCTNCWVGKTRIIDPYESWPSVRPALVLGLSTVLLMTNYDGRVVQSFPLDGRSAVVVFSEDIGIYLICQGNSSTPVVLNASLHNNNASRWTSKTVDFCDDLHQTNSQDEFHPHLVYFRKQIKDGTAITVGVSSTAVSFTPVNETNLLHRQFDLWETAEQEMLSLKAFQGCPMFSSFRTGTGRTGRIIYKFKSGKQDFAVVTELAQQGRTVSGINSIVGGTSLFLMKNRCESQELFALTCSCHGHTPLLMNATAANAEFDNGQLLLYVAFVSSIPNEPSTKSRFVCSFDISLVLNTTAGGFDAEQKLDIIPRQRLCTAVFSEDHVAEILATRTDDQIIILYRNQQTVHLLSQVQSLVKQSSFRFFTSEHGKILAMAISKKDVTVDILTEKKLVRLPLNSCSSYSTCEQCIVARMDNCGWCILENKCTIRQTCFRLNITLTDQRNFWLYAHRGVRASSCPTIRHMHSSFYAAVRTSSKTDHLVKLTLARYPDFDRFNLVVMCVFPRHENHTEGDQTLPVWHVTTNDHPVLECPKPASLRSRIWLSPGHPFYDHQTVLIQVTDGQQSATIATASMIVYKSCNQLSCSECLSLYPTCGWTFRNGTGLCDSSDNNTTQMMTCEAPDATGRTPAADSIDSTKPVVLGNNPIFGPLAEETVIRFTGQNLPGTLAVSVGKDECVIISRDNSSLNCSIRPDASVYEIGNVTLYIADTTKGELRCKNCSFAFTGKRWKALSTVVPGFPLATDQGLAKIDRTGTIFVGATGGAAVAVCCFFFWIIWQTYRKTKKVKIDIECRRKRVSQRLRQQDLGSLRENVRSMVIRLIPPQLLHVGGADASSAFFEEHSSLQ